MANPIEQLAAKAAGTAKAVKAGFNGLRGVFLQLAEEHGELGALMKRVSKSTDGEMRRTHWPQIRTELLSHEKAEITEIYAALSHYEAMRSIVSEHHGEARRLELAIQAVDVEDFASKPWGTAFERLFSLVQQHIEEEEKVFFPDAQKVLGKEQTDALLDRYETAKGDARRHIQAG